MYFLNGFTYSGHFSNRIIYSVTLRGKVRLLIGEFPSEHHFSYILYVCYVVSSFSFISKYLLISLVISSLFHWLFRSLFNFHKFVNPQIPVSYSKFYFLWSENTLYFFLTKGSSLYNVMLVSAVQQHESAINVHISPPPPQSHPFRSSPSWTLCVQSLDGWQR